MTEAPACPRQRFVRSTISCEEERPDMSLTLVAPLPVEDTHPSSVIPLRPAASSATYAAHLAEQVVADDPVFAMEFATAILRALP
jgi:hypothetical protein